MLLKNPCLPDVGMQWIRTPFSNCLIRIIKSSSVSLEVVD